MEQEFLLTCLPVALCSLLSVDVFNSLSSRIRVARGSGRRGAGSQIPDANRRVVAARDERRAEAVAGERGHRSGVAHELRYGLAAVQIPNPNAVIRAARGQAVVVEE